MSLSIPAVSSNTQDYDQQSSAQPAKPTITQQIQTLSSSGESAQEIASALGVPVSEVDTDLGESSSTTTQASALLAANQRLSVHG